MSSMFEICNEFNWSSTFKLYNLFFKSLIQTTIFASVYKPSRVQYAESCKCTRKRVCVCIYVCICMCRERVSEHRVECWVELAGVRVPFRPLYERLKPSLLMDSIALSAAPCQSQRSVSRPSFSFIMRLCTWNACQSEAFRTCHTCAQRMSTSMCSIIVQVKLTSTCKQQLCIH